MDLNPTFGHQELVETLSQGSSNKSHSNSSAKSGSRAKGGQKSSSSSTKSGLGSSHQPLVDEAYRRLGQRLSLQAHGDVTAYWVPPVRHLPVREESAFERFPESGRFRNSKVAKKSYTDHGQHHSKSTPPAAGPQRIVRRLIYEAKASFQRWEQQARGSRLQGYQVSPQRFALSQLSLDHSGRSAPLEETTLSGWSQRSNNRLGSQAKGLLSAVLEGHSDSNASTSPQLPADRSARTSPSQSISTKDSRTVGSSVLGRGGNGGGSVTSSAPAAPLLKRGRCLTSPPDAVANNGLDNVEGNLVVFENDVIEVPRKSIHTLVQVSRSSSRSAEFQIQGLLGQGTFAQVFKCLHVETGKMVAVKIVKNKPAYTRQAAIEIDVFRALQEPDSTTSAPAHHEFMVNLICYFMHKSHLCLVFELLGLNLYEVLKRRQFRGLPLSLVRGIVIQAVSGIRHLSQKNIVHCDLKPENILLLSDDVVERVVSAGETSRMGARFQSAAPERQDTTASLESGTVETKGSGAASSGSSTNTLQTTNMPASLPYEIRLIDFGSACFEGYTAHSYIQSRFYRSPEVLLGLPYDSAIDMWSLGCIAAELYLGLPILPGVHEHDQLGRITEMIAEIPESMLDQGSKSTKYYTKYIKKPSSEPTAVLPRTPSPGQASGSPAPSQVHWRRKTQREFIDSLSHAEIIKLGGIEKLEKQPGNRYFKKQKLADIMLLHAKNKSKDEKDMVAAFMHFLYGLLDPDPWKRYTAFQCAQHPFITGNLNQFRIKTPDMFVDVAEENIANIQLNIYWQAPWDPAICRRKLLNAQMKRERQQALRRNLTSRAQGPSDGHSERLRGQRNESASPAQGRPYGSQVSEGGNFPAQRGPSPPNYVSSDNTATSHVRVSKNTGAMPSSFSDLRHAGQYGQVSMTSMAVGDGNRPVQPQPPYPTSAQSLSELAYDPMYPPTEGDFAHALQRPGVVPMANADSSSSSQSTAINSNHGSSSTFQYGPATNQTPFARNQGNTLPEYVGVASTGRTVPANQNFPQYQDLQGFQGGSRAYSQHGVQSQTSSVGHQSFHSDASFGSYVSNETSPWPMQLPYPAYSSVQGQMPIMLQPGQMAVPQQPIYLSGNPTGGYYYVTVSSTGQPILLQPVAVLNQQGNVVPPGVQYPGPPGTQFAMPQQDQQHSIPGSYETMPHMNPPAQFPGPAGNPQRRQSQGRGQQNPSRHRHYRGGTSM